MPSSGRSGGATYGRLPYRPLGSSLGGLPWDDVRQRIEAALEGMDDLAVVLFEPGGGPADDRLNRSTKVPRMTRGRAVLVNLIRRYLDGLLDPFVSLLEVHKLMYFMQEAGEPLELRFEKALYGPYAENLRHMFRDHRRPSRIWLRLRGRRAR